MTTAQPITPPAAPTFTEAIAEITPLVDAVPGEGPPIILLAIGWVFLALMLAGPFAFLVTLVVAMVLVAAIVVALAVAIVALVRAPGRLVRRARRATTRERAPRLVPVDSTRVVA
jgi:hypothetical protein